MKYVAPLSLLRWFRERAPMLRYMQVACVVLTRIRHEAPVREFRLTSPLPPPLPYTQAQRLQADLAADEGLFVGDDIHSIARGAKGESFCFRGGQICRERSTSMRRLSGL